MSDDAPDVPDAESGALESEIAAEKQVDVDAHEKEIEGTAVVGLGDDSGSYILTDNIIDDAEEEENKVCGTLTARFLYH